MLNKTLYLWLILTISFSSLIAMDHGFDFTLSKKTRSLSSVKSDENAMILRSGRRLPKLISANNCLQLEHNPSEHGEVMGTNGQIKTGVYYRIQSKFGRYLDMRHEPSGDVHDAWSITEARINSGAWANDSYQVRLIDQGNGYYRIQSKFGRYLDMRHEARGDVHSAWSITEARMNAGAWANDSYQIRLIDQGNGYYRIQSKFGRYLDMRQEAIGDVHSVWSITEARMNAGAWANDSYQVRFIPQGDSAPSS